MQATSVAATDSNDDASPTQTPESPKTVTVGYSSTSGQETNPAEPVTSVPPKTVTVGPSFSSAQETNPVNTVLGASQTSARGGSTTGTGSVTGFSGTSKAKKEDGVVGMRAGIAVMVALITLFVS